MLQPSFNVKTRKQNNILWAILANPEKCFSLMYDTIDYKVTRMKVLGLTESKSGLTKAWNGTLEAIKSQNWA